VLTRILRVTQVRVLSLCSIRMGMSKSASLQREEKVLVSAFMFGLRTFRAAIQTRIVGNRPTELHSIWFRWMSLRSRIVILAGTFSAIACTPWQNYANTFNRRPTITSAASAATAHSKTAIKCPPSLRFSGGIFERLHTTVCAHVSPLRCS
jgi:hypothetical protein